MEAPTRIRKQSEKKSKVTDTLEKDEIELRLEKALFGDNAGFLESLKRQDVGQDKALVRIRDDASEDSDVEDGEEGLSDVADEDVCLASQLEEFPSLTVDPAFLSRHRHRRTPCSCNPRA